MDQVLDILLVMKAFQTLGFMTDQVAGYPFPSSVSSAVRMSSKWLLSLVGRVVMASQAPLAA